MLFEAQRSKETARGAVSVAVSRQEVCTVAASRHGHQKSRHSRHPQAFGVKITRPGASRRFARALRKQMKLTARMHAPAGQFSTGVAGLSFIPEQGTGENGTSNEQRVECLEHPCQGAANRLY